MVRNTVAVLIDGAFFLKRYKSLKKTLPSAEVMAADMCRLANLHVNKEHDRLYRIFYYDCPPLINKVRHPITKKEMDFGRSTVGVFRLQLFDELKRHRKVALRLGRLKDNDGWKLSPWAMKRLLKGEVKWDELKESDLVRDTVQKGVDMRMGIDISSIALKRLVNKIILVTGDSDFVPAAKLARREGVDVVLDPMWAHINPELYEHIDGLKNLFAGPKDGKDSSKLGHSKPTHAFPVAEVKPAKERASGTGE